MHIYEINRVNVKRGIVWILRNKGNKIYEIILCYF